MEKNIVQCLFTFSNLYAILRKILAQFNPGFFACLPKSFRRADKERIKLITWHPILVIFIFKNYNLTCCVIRIIQNLVFNKKTI